MFLISTLVFIMFTLTGCNSSEVAISDSNVPVIIDAPNFSNVSTSFLVEQLGNPESIEPWENKTAKGTFDMLIYGYSKDNNYYEFIIANDAIVRMNIYSEKNWFNSGDDFSYSNMKKSDILAMFGIIPSSKAKVAEDTGSAYRISSTSDSISDFWVPMLDESTNTFGLVKITFNSDYF